MPCSQERQTHHSGHTSHYHLLQGTSGCAMARLMSRFANALANANARRSLFLLAGASNQPQTRDAPLSLLMCHLKPWRIPPSSGIPPAWMNTVKVYCSALDPGLGHCKVVAHVVIPMDRMYNSRAATMNTIASGSLMRWIALAFQHTSKPPEVANFSNESTKVQNPRRSLAASKCSSVYTVVSYSHL